MSHSISHTEPTDQKHSINLCNHERYPVHLQCLRNIQKIKYPDFQAMTYLFRPPKQIICDEATEFSSAIIQAILCMLKLQTQSDKSL